MELLKLQQVWYVYHLFCETEKVYSLCNQSFSTIK